MKRNVHLSITLLIALMVVCTGMYAQAPGTFNYQGIARNNAGAPLATQAISVKISILQDNASGAAIYTETHSVTTTAQGYFSLLIGTGTPALGEFGTINWANGHSKWLQTSIDPTGGSSYTLMGASQLVSVPFALYAARSGAAPSNLKAKAPLAFSNDSVLINPGTHVGDLISWDGDNWVAKQPVELPDYNITVGNVQPYLTLNYCIALFGVFPSRNGDEPYVGEIDLFPYNFAPREWAFCDGSLISIAENTALFSLLGTNFGGNGVTTFALPDLRGRVPISSGQGPGLQNYILGQTGGTETNIITIHR